MTAIASKRQPELRLKAEDLRSDYKNGLLNSHSYLYYLIRALRKNGWKLHIPNISIFCEQWHISERSFYRAKNKLHELGLLKEKIYGSIDLWIDPHKSVELDADNSGSETDNSGSDSASCSSGSDNSGSETDNSGSETPLNPLPNKAYSASTPSSHLFSPLSYPVLEREIRKEAQKELEEIAEFSDRIPETAPRGNLKPLASLLSSVETTQPVAEIPVQDKSSAAEPEFLDWVISKVKQFPKPPTFPRQTAITMIKRFGTDLKAEYEDYVRRCQQSAALIAPVAPAPMVIPEPEPESIASIFTRLKAKWNLPFRVMREAVQQELADHPEWNIVITDERLELAQC